MAIPILHTGSDTLGYPGGRYGIYYTTQPIFLIYSTQCPTSDESEQIIQVFNLFTFMGRFGRRRVPMDEKEYIKE